MRAAGLALLLGLSACAAAAPPPPPATALACPEGTRPAVLAEAYFGRSSGGRHAVTDADWDRFLAEEVTPRFPDGFTVLDATGQWRGGDGRIVREGSKLLVVLVPGTDAAAARARLLPVAEAHKARFRQESVLTSYSAACIAF